MGSSPFTHTITYSLIAQPAEHWTLTPGVVSSNLAQAAIVLMYSSGLRGQIANLLFTGSNPVISSNNWVGMRNWVNAASCKPVTLETLEVRVLSCPPNLMMHYMKSCSASYFLY